MRSIQVRTVIDLANFTPTSHMVAVTHRAWLRSGGETPWRHSAVDQDAETGRRLRKNTGTTYTLKFQSSGWSFQNILTEATVSDRL